MLKRLRDLSIFAVIAVAGAAAQQAPSFEVASIRPSIAAPGPLRNVLWLPGGRVAATALTLKELIRSAYAGDGIQLMTQIVEGPAWLDADRFDLIAKVGEMPPGDADGAIRQREAMLRSLLADRFKLRVHADTRALPVFDLVLSSKAGTRGPGLKVSTCHREAASPDSPAPGGHPCVPFRMVAMNPDTGITMGSEGITMAEFAASLVRFPEIGRPIRDRTGLAGAFDVQFTLAIPAAPGPVIAGGGPGLDANTDSGILRALQEQLGLKLEGRRDQTAVIVVESAERPIQN